jgi:hypothetical protein
MKTTDFSRHSLRYLPSRTETKNNGEALANTRRSRSCSALSACAYVEGSGSLSLEELVELTGLNKNTIKVQLYRTRQRLMQAARRLRPSERPYMRLHVSRIALHLV